MSIDIPYSENKQDQMNMAKVGGFIVINKYGQPKFRFRTKLQYEKYEQLKKTR